ncbi:MAG TPA: hypothetical protein PKE29_16735 [Phycisphaerales bacterium]|nr:hypothetical protein [Phycisphaerales bacterium]
MASQRSSTSPTRARPTRPVWATAIILVVGAGIYLLRLPPSPAKRGWVEHEGKRYE